MEEEKRMGPELFPITFNLKVIMLKGQDSGDGRAILENIFLRLGIPYSDWQTKTEPESRYVRYSVQITLSDRDRMDVMYRELGREERVKAAI